MINERNGKQAAIKAGYAESCAEITASKLLKNTKVIELLEKAAIKVEERSDKKKDDVIKELISIGFSNMKDYADYTNTDLTLIPLQELTREQAAAIQSVEMSYDSEGRKKIKFKLYPKTQALENLGTLFGLDFRKAPVNTINIFEIYASMTKEQLLFELQKYLPNPNQITEGK